MEKKAPNQKTTKKTSQPKSDELIIKAIKWKQKTQIKKQKNPSYPKPNGLKAKGIKWKKKTQMRKRKKSIIA